MRLDHHRRQSTFIRLGWATGLVALIALGFLSPWHAVTAQTETQVPTPLATATKKEVAYDNPVVGQISDAVVQETWTLNVPFRDRISISVDRANNTLVPNVELRDPDGKSLAHADHDATAAHAAINNLKLKSAGKYSIIVGRDKGQDGKTGGNYTLKVSLLGTGPEDAALYELSSEPIRPVRPATGEITNAKWIDIQGWTPVSKDHSLLTVTRTNGTLMPTITVIGPNNTEIGHAEPDPTGAKAALNVVIPEPGEYEIRIGRVGGQDGATSGKYTLVQTVVGIGDDNTSLKVIQGMVQFDTPRQGTLTGRLWQNVWAFNADSPAAITIKMTRDSGTLLPLVKLFDINFKELAVAQPDDTWATATISNYQLPAAGQYLVVASRADEVNGVTTGDYEFTITQSTK